VTPVVYHPLAVRLRVFGYRSSLVHLLATRPIFHKLDETIRASSRSCSRRNWKPASPPSAAKDSWPAIIADLDSLTETEIDQDGKRFLPRSTPRPRASIALRAAGVALPPTVQAIAIN
jgi:hypothetical protein